MAVNIQSENCTGGSGTFGAPDTTIQSAHMQRQGGGSVACNVQINGTSWTATCNPLPTGTYRLCATGDVSPEVCDAWFNC
jgi:hypothetical protein